MTTETTITAEQLRARLKTGPVKLETDQRQIEFFPHATDPDIAVWYARELVHGGTQPGTNLVWMAWDIVDFGNMPLDRDPMNLLSWLDEANPS